MDNGLFIEPDGELPQFPPPPLLLVPQTQDLDGPGPRTDPAVKTIEGPLVLD